MDTNCSEYLWENPTLLLKSYYIHSKKHNCKTDVTNHIIFIFIISLIIGLLLSLFTNDKMKIIFGLVLINLLYTVYLYFRMTPTKKDTTIENFKLKQKNTVPDNDLVEEIKDVEEVIGKSLTYPTSKNPFMNVLVNEIKYNPSRPPAASVLEPFVATNLDDMFKTQFVNDPTDVFGRSQSQRQFYTTPSTTVPNDQDSYQNWLYRIPGKTCKEGGREACSLQTGSAGAIVPWLTEN